MTGFETVLALSALLGFLPLAIFLYRSGRAKRILATGLPAKATVYRVLSTRRPPQDTVHYSFIDERAGQQYKGRFSIGVGKYKVGDAVDIYYDADQPHHSTVKGAWGSWALLASGIVIAVFVLFAVYEQWRTHQNLNQQ